jgi:hypothetical protein
MSEHGENKEVDEENKIDPDEELKKMKAII